MLSRRKNSSRTATEVSTVTIQRGGERARARVRVGHTNTNGAADVTVLITSLLRGSVIS